MVTRGRVESSEGILRFRRAGCCRCGFSADLPDAADRPGGAVLRRRTPGHARPPPAGGPTDTIARIMAERMGRSLGQTVVVENTTGAGGSIGVGRVARAAPDGYVLGIGHIGTHVISGAVYQLPFDLLR